MKLYFTPGTCSLAPHIALREAALTFGLEQVDLAARTTKGGKDFTKINPKGYVPALELDGGQILTEVAVILQYVADAKPKARLAPPAGTFERYRVLEWLNFISSELHKGFAPMFRPTTPDDYRKLSLENIAGRLGFVDRQLAGKDYLMGRPFTIADAYCFTIVRWSKMFDIDLQRWSNLEAFMARTGGRPQVRAALEAEAVAE